MLVADHPLAWFVAVMADGEPPPPQLRTVADFACFLAAHDEKAEA